MNSACETVRAWPDFWYTGWGATVGVLIAAVVVTYILWVFIRLTRIIERNGF